jgi:hypothetical protein
MATVWKNGKREHEQDKASSLDATVSASVQGAKGSKRDKKPAKRQDDADLWPISRADAEQRIKRRNDLITVGVIAVLAALLFFGYRGFKQWAQPDTESVWVEYSVVLYDVPFDVDADALVDQTLRLSNQKEGGTLGTVQTARWESIPNALCVTVRAQASYTRGGGYTVDGLRIMAGVTPTHATFELGDMLSSQGVIVSLAAD